jgi:hypothetical protein
MCEDLSLENLMERMSTTPEQKAMILDGCVERRRKRDLEVTPEAMLKFNWPSLSDEEAVEVMQHYNQRRSKMKAAKHVIKLELGPRLYVEKFDGTNEAKTFLDKVVGKDKPVWKTSTQFTTKEDALSVSCEELEDIMEFEKKDEDLWVIPDKMLKQIEAFMTGKWPKVKNSPDPEVGHVGDKKRPVRAPNRDLGPVKKRTAIATRAPKDDMTALGDICAKLKIDPSDARKAMRVAKWEKPGSVWAWPNKEAAAIEKKLKQLMKGA